MNQIRLYTVKDELKRAIFTAQERIKEYVEHTAPYIEQYKVEVEIADAIYLFANDLPLYLYQDEVTERVIEPFETDKYISVNSILLRLSLGINLIIMKLR